MSKALVIIDMQNGFVNPEFNELPVPGAQHIVPIIADLQTKFANTEGHSVIITTDCHTENHCSFVSDENTGGWPPHCIEGTKGHEIVPELKTNSHYHVARKGYNKHVDAMSAFQDFHDNESDLNDHLKQNDIKTLYFTGVATDYCVRFNVVDAIERGYEVFVIIDAIAGVGVHEDDIQDAKDIMLKAGAKFITSNNLDLPQLEHDVEKPKECEATIAYIN